MKKASIRDLHIRTSELVREASEGAVIQIERRGEPVAELRPLSRKTKKSALPNLFEVWKRLPQVKTDSGRFLEGDR
jgi:antitoxin (DNA-binding transcriptional repressor) of toxin-antitoxin stability system